MVFYKGTQAVGYWSIGPDYFKAEGSGTDTLYRPVSRAEVDHLLFLLGLNKGVVMKGSRSSVS